MTRRVENPKSPGPKSDKIWADAVRMAALREEVRDGKKIKRLQIVADNLVRCAMEGDMAAVKELGDRLDGKPKQAIEHSGDAENPVIIDSPREKLARVLKSTLAD